MLRRVNVMSESGLERGLETHIFFRELSEGKRTQ